jgi:hypothetical protein
MEKSIIVIVILVIFILLFIEKCSLINLSTADIFRPKFYNDFKSLQDTVQSENYEIVRVDGEFPILFDSTKNEFYLAKGKGLTKIDSKGNVIFSADLSNEGYNSVFDFANFIPYVFAEGGVYDFSENKLSFFKFSQKLNAENEVSDKDFKSFFEKFYQDAELVVYETDRNTDDRKLNHPMYFKVKEEWILLFSQKGDNRFTHQRSSEDNDIIGQIDFENFPSKFANKRLVVLKDAKQGVYLTKQIGQKIDDEYLKNYYTQILNEQKLDYQTTNCISMLSRKKDDYYFTGSYLDLPNWVRPSFINTAYFELMYYGEKLFFKEKAIKYNSDSQCKDGLYLYELPKNMRKSTRVAFLHYDLDVGGFYDANTGIAEPIIKNTGLYMIRPKSKYTLTNIYL